MDGIRVNIPSDLSWAQIDRANALERERDAWRERAQELLRQIEDIADAVRNGRRVFISDREGTVEVPIPTAQGEG